MAKYSSDPTWASITPIPLDDGSSYYDDNDRGDSTSGALPLATIAYSEEYTEATAYLRAVMAENEMSERALALTEDVIQLNPAHYTIWLYRAKILFNLGKDLKAELAWLDGIAQLYLKNYQIWHHRQLIMSDRTTFPTLPPTELDFLKQMFDLDAKNYHVWTYRHWLVRHFALWDSTREIEDVETLLSEDVRNNSAWNHRWMLKFGPRGSVDSGLPNPTGQRGDRGKFEVIEEELIDSEIEYVKSKIVLAPENKSPWNYVRGVLRSADRPVAELKKFAEKFVIEEVNEDGSTENFQVKSSLAVEWLADVFAEEAQAQVEDAVEQERKKRAVSMLTLLKDKYDPIRKNYWDYRIRLLDENHNLTAAAA